MTNERTRVLQATLARGPDANALEFFALVAGAGSFAAAGRRLGLTRAGVSQRVAQIEAAVGTALFVRHTRALGLTEAGRRLLARARAVHEAAETARRGLRAGALAADDGQLTGTLRITAVPIFGQAVLGPLLASFQARHPDLRLEIRFTPRRVDLMREDVDLAFRLTRDPPQDCIAQSVLPFRVYACAAPGAVDTVADPRDLAHARCLVFSQPAQAVTLVWERTDGSARTTVAVEPAVVADDLGSLLSIARAGGGIVFAPDFALTDDLRRGSLVDALPGWRLAVAEAEAVMAITLPLDVAPASARALVRHMQDRLRGRPAGP